MRSAGGLFRFKGSPLSTLRTGYYGRPSLGSAESGFKSVGANHSAASVYDRALNNLWVTAGGFFGGRTGGSEPSVRMTVYDTDGSKNLTTRIGYMEHASPTNAMTAAKTGGATVGMSVVKADNAPTDTAFMIFAGSRYGIDLLTDANGLGVSVYLADFPAVDNPTIYNRTSVTDPPPADTAYGSVTADTHVGVMTSNLGGYINNAPEKPTASLAPSGSVTSTAPTFTGRFDDLNGTWGGAHSGHNVGDQLLKYQVQLTSVADTTTLLWSRTYTASEDEATADLVGRDYDGSTLTRGTPYQWKIRMADQFGEWSDWSDPVVFTPAAAGHIALAGNPTGKILTITPSFDGTWTHQSGTSMADVRVKLYSKRGTLLQDTGTKVKAALDGATFTVTWAQTGFADLAWGQIYQYTMMGYDGTNWSSESAMRSFNTDAPPRIANHLSPDGSQVVSTPPILRFTMTDPDDDYTGTLVGYAELLSPMATGMVTLATYNPANSKWEVPASSISGFLTTNGYGIYTWDAYGYDGTVYSGGTTLIADAVHSVSASFDYEAGPVIAIAAPLDNATVATSNLTVSWSVTSGGPQVKYRVLLTADGDASTVAYDSGTITSTATSHVIPTGYYRNLTNYDLYVYITNSTPTTGVSDVVNIAISYTPPTSPVNLQVTTIPVSLDTTDTAAMITWDQTVYSEPEFEAENLYRSADSGPDRARILLARIDSAGITAFVDYTLASGATTTYELTNVIATGLDLVESDPVSDTASIALTATVLTLVGDAGNHRAVLTNVRERPDSQTISEAVYQPLDGSNPITVRGRANYYSASITASIIDSVSGDAAANVAAFRDLVAQKSAIACMRYADGTKRFVTISNVKITPQASNIYFDVSFTARDEEFQEGVV